MPNSLKTIVLLTFLPILPFLLQAQQTPYLAFYRSNWSLVNPAANDPWSCYQMTNWDHINMFTAAYRRQGVGSKIEDAPEFYAFTFEHTPEVIRDRRDQRQNNRMPFKWGLSGLKDQAGPLSTIGVFGFFSYHWPLGAGSFHIGAGVGGVQFGLDPNKLKNFDPADPVLQDIGRSCKFDASIGIMYRDNRHYLGLSMPQTLTDVYTQNRKTHFYLTAGKIFSLRESDDVNGLQLEPSFWFRWTPGLVFPTERGGAYPISADINTRIHIPFGNDNIHKLWTGIGIGTALNLNLEGGFEFLSRRNPNFGHNYNTGDLKQYRLGFNATLPLSSRRNPLGTAFEIILAYAWNANG